MWCDTFDLDLYKVLPEARDILAPVKDVKLYTYGHKTDGLLNHPSVWNHYMGMVAFFGLIPTHVKPEAFYTDDELVSCTFEEAVRDCWPHNYAILLSVFIPSRGTKQALLWHTGMPEMKEHFFAIMAETRKWEVNPPRDLVRVRSAVLDSLRMAVSKLQAVLASGPVRQDAGADKIENERLQIE